MTIYPSVDAIDKTTNPKTKYQLCNRLKLKIAYT